MPIKSPAQKRFMLAAAHTKGGYGGVPQSVGKEFIAADDKLRTLYVSRPLKNADAVRDWATKAGFKTTLPASDMHATIAFSKTLVDWNAAPDGADFITQEAGAEGRTVEQLGPEGAVVLRFESEALAHRWQEFKDIGASWDHDGFRPHVTIAYYAGDIDITKIEPYDGPLEFGEEVFKEVDIGWADKVKSKLQATDNQPQLATTPNTGIPLAAGTKKTKMAKRYDLGRLMRAGFAKDGLCRACGGRGCDKCGGSGIAPVVKRNVKGGLGGAFDGMFAGLGNKIAQDSRKEPELAFDRAMLADMSRYGMAFDRAPSMRKVDKDGHMLVESSIISAAAVNDYRGDEIPGWKELGLKADQIYPLYRTEEDMEKGAPTLHGKPLLIIHRGVTAQNHPRAITVGTVINPIWENPNLRAELSIWDGEAIKLIESGEKKSLSAGYRYIPVMESGVYKGRRFAGKMTAIEFNHCALVVEPRVQGAFVGDNITDPWSIIESAILGLEAR